MGYKVAILGATGNVGREFLSILEQREFPVREIFPLASHRSVGTNVRFGGEKIPCRDVHNFDFSGIDIVLSSPGANASKEYSPKAATAGAIVIDNTSAWRLDPQVPLIVPEVNEHAVTQMRKNIIANPNCSTIQLVVALKPLHHVAKVARVVVSTYQSTSGGGKRATDELSLQARSIYQGALMQPEIFSKQIAFNCIPHIDIFMDNGYTKEEWKMRMETKKILETDAVEVSATAVRVPVFIGHAESVTAEFETYIDAPLAKEALRKAKGVCVVDEPINGGYATPVECAGKDAVYISRLRNDTSKKNALAFWCVADNVRKGAALNAIQIAESLIRKNVL